MMIQNFTARRTEHDALSTIARWSDQKGDQLCWCLEPGAQTPVHPCIPIGTYPLRLRTGTLKDAEYRKKFGGFWHKGMIEIADVPDRFAIEFHIGNTVHDTEGCSLAGLMPIEPPGNLDSGHWEVSGSTIAYQKVYPALRDAILGDGAQITFLTMGAA